MMFLHNVFCSKYNTHRWYKLPRVGRAEKLKLHDAIPPLSLIEDLIQGKRVETLVKMA